MGIGGVNLPALSFTARIVFGIKFQFIKHQIGLNEKTHFYYMTKVMIVLIIPLVILIVCNYTKPVLFVMYFTFYCLEEVLHARKQCARNRK